MHFSCRCGEKAVPLQSIYAAMVESVDTKDLKSFGQKWLCGFKSHSRYETGKEEGEQLSSLWLQKGYTL